MRTCAQTANAYHSFRPLTLDIYLEYFHNVVGLWYEILNVIIKFQHSSAIYRRSFLEFPFFFFSFFFQLNEDMQVKSHTGGITITNWAENSIVLRERYVIQQSRDHNVCVIYPLRGVSRIMSNIWIEPFRKIDVKCLTGFWILLCLLSLIIFVTSPL